MPSESRPAWTRDISRLGSAPRMELSTLITINCTASDELAARQRITLHLFHSRAENNRGKASSAQCSYFFQEAIGVNKERLTCCMLLCISTGIGICSRNLAWQLHRSCGPCCKVAVQECAALWRGSEDLPTKGDCRNLQPYRVHHCILAG